MNIIQESSLQKNCLLHDKYPVKYCTLSPFTQFKSRIICSQCLLNALRTNPLCKEESIIQISDLKPSQKELSEWPPQKNQKQKLYMTYLDQIDQQIEQKEPFINDIREKFHNLKLKIIQEIDKKEKELIISMNNYLDQIIQLKENQKEQLDISLNISSLKSILLSETSSIQEKEQKLNEFLLQTSQNFDDLIKSNQEKLKEIQYINFQECQNELSKFFEKLQLQRFNIETLQESINTSKDCLIQNLETNIPNSFPFFKSTLNENMKNCELKWESIKEMKQSVYFRHVSVLEKSKNAKNKYFDSIIYSQPIDQKSIDKFELQIKVSSFPKFYKIQNGEQDKQQYLFTLGIIDSQVDKNQNLDELLDKCICSFDVGKELTVKFNTLVTGKPLIQELKQNDILKINFQSNFDMLYITNETQDSYAVDFNKGEIRNLIGKLPKCQSVNVFLAFHNGAKRDIQLQFQMN